MPKLNTTTEIITNTDANIAKIKFISAPFAKSTPTNIGANIPPILPNPAAQPEPNALIEVGYISGV